MILATVPLAMLLAVGTTSAPPATNDPQLEQMLLSLDDMPTGWAVDTSDDFDLNQPDPKGADDCGADLFPALADTPAPTAAITFTAAAAGLLDFNYLAEAIIDSGDNEANRASAEAFVPTLTACPATPDTDGNTTTYSETSFPDLGDASSAVLVSTDDGMGFSFDATIAVIADGNHLIFLIGVGDGADGEFFDDIARTAVNKLD